METSLSLLRQARANFIELVEAIPLDELNLIPPGFSNNIWWNFSHAVVSTQILCYGLSGLDKKVPEEWVERYKNGTRPMGAADQPTVDGILDYASKSIEVLEADLKAGIFKSFSSYTTSQHFTLNSIQDALAICPIHESTHMGYAMAIRKAIQKSPVK